MGSPHFEVGIVGGGAIGVNLAYFLAERGISVGLFEADRLGGGSTVRSAGGIRQQFGSERKIRLAMKSREHLGEYAAESDSVEIRENGYLFLARTESEATGFETDAERQRDLGLDVELLDPEECERFVPDLVTDDLVLGKYCPTDCLVDPAAVTDWLGDRAAAMGAQISEGEPVTDVRVSDGAVTGIETEQGTYDCDVVVDAAGVWAPTVAATVDVSLPITPSRIQLLFTEEAHVPTDAPFVVDIHERRYFRPADGPGATMFGGANVDDDDTADPDSYDTDYDDAFVDQTVDFARKRLGTTDLSVIDGWAGLKGLTPDGNPLVGEVDGVNGFYVAAGCNGHGLILAPAIGEILAGYLDTGSWGEISLAPYDPDRFDGDETNAAGFMDVS
ncbi:NAD(P)/FAD-dependent oxidoreductase [Halobellus salinisoli]|uniref:NAD(P)/FAD-dependent oxidoreductase n=1 Tax=Halobellus salinisoli TaxID=3108500 RepID=UPI003009E363